MTTFADLLAAVDAAFAVTGRECTPWDDPHPGRSPLDEEYSRVTEPAKWRIVGARAEAWTAALVDAGVAEVVRDAESAWVEAPSTVVTRTDVVVPRRPGTLPLVLARNRIEGVDDAGVTIGVGDPAVVVCWIPDCGCDACDSGSQDVLDELDEWLSGIVLGEFRHLDRHVDRRPAPPGEWRWATPGADDPPIEPTELGDDSWALPARERITVIRSDRWSWSGRLDRDEVEAALADPAGWHELRGVPWLDA